MRNFFKTITRSVKNSAAKLISIMAIIFIGIMFIAGLGTLMPTIQRSISDYLNESNAADVIIMGAFSDSDVTRLKASDNVSGVSYITSVDFYSEATSESGETSYRTYYFYGDPTNAAVTALSVEGSLPASANEVAVERSSDYTAPRSIGDMVEINGYTYTVTAIISNPLIFSKQGEPNRLNSDVMLQDIYYFNASCFSGITYYTELHVTFSALEGADRFSDGYSDKVNTLTASLKEEFGESYSYLTQESNASCVTLDMYVEKVNNIVLIFPLFFILVAALTVSTTMTRTVEEDRPVIGCYTTLGFSKSTIVFKYAFLAAACCVIASVLGIVTGLYLVPRVIYNGFGSTFFLPSISNYVQPLMGLIAFVVMLIVITGVTVLTAVKSLKCKPAVLLQPKAPKAGKKIFLEHIRFLWNRLSFKYKACARNILRYKKHFAMTVISVCGSTALVFAGFSLINRAVANTGGGSSTLGSALMPIAALVIVFAVALSAFVIYNLTNLNIGERKREIATLRVLGYTKGEVAAYIYREITVMTVIGIITGIAVGCVLIQIVFGILDMGSLKDVNWWAYICAVLVVALFTALVDLMLTPKINSVNMTESLKSVE